MTTIEITDDQWDRIEALRTELAANHAGTYATVGDADVLAYLLDLAATVEDPNCRAKTGEPDSNGADGNADGDDEPWEPKGWGPEKEADEESEGEDEDEEAEDEKADEDSRSGENDGQLNAMLSLLDTHADKWREADGDARYEVDLPDGGVETARTKDDVRALLFKHHR